MNPCGNFPKNSFFFVVSVAKPKKNRRLCLYICVGEFCPVFWQFLHEHSVDSDEAMQRGDEALNASLLQFLSIGKRFIATISSQR
jgi:hypothetical protein